MSTSIVTPSDGSQKELPSTQIIIIIVYYAKKGSSSNKSTYKHKTANITQY